MSVLFLVVYSGVVVLSRGISKVRDYLWQRVEVPEGKQRG